MTKLQSKIFMHHAQRRTETQCASLLSRSTNDLQGVRPRIVAVDGVASCTATPTSGDVDLLIHCSDRETANARLRKVVDGCPAAGYRVERADIAHGSFCDADSQHWMLGDLLWHAAENVEYVVDGNGKFTSGPRSGCTRHLGPALRRNVETLCYLRWRSIRLVTTEHVEFIVPCRHCRPAHGIQHPPTCLKVITSSGVGNKHRCLQPFCKVHKHRTTTTFGFSITGQLFRSFSRSGWSLKIKFWEFLVQDFYRPGG